MWTMLVLPTITWKYLLNLYDTLLDKLFEDTI